MKTIALTFVAGLGATAAGAAVPTLHIPLSMLDAPPTLTRPATIAVATAAYVDGTYTGPAIDAYYGVVQVQATVQQGQITALKILQYPYDRRESLVISQQALPLLRNEVVKVQSAKVNIISGATLTSHAFTQSLAAALAKSGGSGSGSGSPSGSAPGSTSI